MEIRAKGKNIRMSPRKIRLVSGLIKGLTVDQARTQLEFNKRIASKVLIKLLDSAVANAVENFGADKSNLLVKSVIVNGGTTLKRWMPRAHGRATPIRKRTSHVILTLSEIVESGKLIKKTKTDDKSDLIKVGSTEFDELQDISSDKSSVKKENKKSTAVSTKGFASKILNRKTGSK